MNRFKRAQLPVAALLLMLVCCPEEQRFTLTILTEGSGSVSAIPVADSYAEGAAVSLQATAAGGWRFDHWEGHLAGSDNPASLTMNANKSVTAVFTETAAAQHALTTHTLGNGTVTLDPPAHRYDHGAAVTVSAEPGEGWSFDHWTGDYTGTASSFIAVIEDDTEVTAVFRDQNGTFMQYGYGILTCMDVAPNGYIMATGGYDGNIRLWDTRNGRLIHTCYGHAGPVSSVAFSASGGAFVSASFDGTVRVWQADNGAETCTIPFDTALYSAALSPDDANVLVSRQGDKPVICSVATASPEAVLTGHIGEVFDVAWSPDGATLATAGTDGTAMLWTAAAAHLHTLPHGGLVYSVAFSPDSQTLLTGWLGGDAELWHVSSGLGITTYHGHTGTVLSAGFSPDGLHVVTGSLDHTARVWETETATLLQTLSGHERSVVAVACSEAGLFTAGSDGKVIGWDLATGSQRVNFSGYTTGLNAAVFSPDGSLVATAASDGRIRLYDAETAELLRTFVGHSEAVRDLAFSPDGSAILSGSDDDTARLWDVETGAVLSTFLGHADDVRGVAFSPDGANVATASEDRTARIWHTATGVELAPLLGHGDAVLDVAYSHDGSVVAVASADNTAVLWNAAAGTWIRTFPAHTDNVNSVVFSQDDTLLLTGSDDATIKVWSVETAGVKFSVPTAMPVYCAVFTPNEKSAITANVSSLRAWELETGLPSDYILGHAGVVHTVTYSPDGLSLLSACDDGTARRYRAP